MAEECKVCLSVLCYINININIYTLYIKCIKNEVHENDEALLCYKMNEMFKIMRRTPQWNDEIMQVIAVEGYERIFKLEKRTVFLAEQGILIAAAARRSKDFSLEWEYYKDEDLEIMNEEEFHEKQQEYKYLINFRTLFKDNGMRFGLDITNEEFDKLLISNPVGFNQLRSAFMDEYSNIKILYRKDAGLGVDVDCNSRYTLSYEDLKNYWIQYDVLKAKGGICVQTENLLGCRYIFDYRNNINIVHKYEILKKRYKMKKWYGFQKYNLSHWFFNCGNACIWNGEYIGTDKNRKKGKNALYKIEITGGYKYKMRFNKIYNIDDIVLVIVDCIEADKGVVFETNHLDEIEDKIENYLLKTMAYIQFRLNDMGKNNVDAIKLVLSNKMIKRNKTHCNNGRCLKRIKKRKSNDEKKPRILCKGCGTIYYCCKKCANKDWNVHKNRCFRNRLSTNRRLSQNKSYLFDWA